jgi:hypothetical protein
MRAGTRLRAVPWTEEEDAIIRADFSRGLLAEDSKNRLPARTLGAVQQRRHALGLRKSTKGDGAQAKYVTFMIQPGTMERIDRLAEAGGLTRASYVRQTFARIMGQAEKQAGEKFESGLSPRARAHFSAEAAKRGISVAELIGRLLETTAECQLTNAVLDDEPQRASA